MWNEGEVHIHTHTQTHSHTFSLCVGAHLSACVRVYTYHTAKEKKKEERTKERKNERTKERKFEGAGIGPTVKIDSKGVKVLGLVGLLG